jgi:hypothetical protein
MQATALLASVLSSTLTVRLHPMPDIPQIEAPQLERLIAAVLPDASFTTENISPIHGSWRIEIIRDNRRFAFVWGPISGFGGIDYSVVNDDVFTHCDEYLWSLDDARRFLSDRI